MLAALSSSPVVYQNVPPEIERITAYEWRTGSAPVPIEISVTRQASRWTVALSNETVVVLLHRHDGAYLLDGPIAITEDRGQRRLDGVWRRMLEGGVQGDPGGAPPIEWLPANGSNADPWPACWWAGSARWSCLGVPQGAAGVIFAAGGQRLWSAIVGTQSAASLSGSSWGRLIVIRDREGDAPPRMKVTIARPVVPPQRAKSVRVEAAALADARVTPVEGSSVWIAGDSSPPSAWIEIRSARSGPAYLLLTDVTDGSPQVPVRVLLDDTRVVDAAVVSDRAVPAAGALATVFRVIDPPTAPGSREPPPRRVFVAEAMADPQGRFRVEGLGDAAYEIVAWHAQLGRGSLLLSAGADRVTIHIRPPGIARGRVLTGGKPASGVDVIAVPDPAAFAAAEDPIDVKGGDARTGADGRFAVALAAGGGGELRVGGGTHAIRRVPLPRAPLPIVDLGDIELGRAIVLSIVLDQDPGCDVRAAGPLGRAGLRIVTAIRAAPGVFGITLPEEGSWEFTLLCGRDERALMPPVVRVTEQSSSLVFAVR
jgi:hypothetical protein